ncbi:acyltransferase family protein [Sphingobacterium sp. UDSM-2020]|uniref:acyltransferase family protein n=1 Tax=Sphingobacterium sp. UDSM-2020 TaxID=2795738 RepID=UPI001938BDFF|nr:DUF5009 domain-containing protein [Sphingobacterium sp. UDSM-2020]QQD11967.1 DUF5009 domain-containing protein [Sphingobacterium sp. UDSM-2020]
MDMLSNKSNRLESLDVLRGFDLFLLVGLQPILIGVGQVWDNIYYHSLLRQFDHEIWMGFRFWDLVMPLFLFMTGITIPFSLDNKKGLPTGPIYRHIFKRFLILWILGMVMQGNLLSWDWQQFKLYSNTLQAIAMGYVVTAVLYLNLGIRKVVMIAIVLLIVYAIPFLLDGDYSAQSNFAIKVDRMLLRGFMDGAYWKNGNAIFSDQYDYSWIWSSLTFSVTVMMGCLAGKMMKIGIKTNPKRVFWHLVLTGVVCLAIGLLWSLQMPIIKRIWTSSMTLFSGGICFLMMAVFYYIIDLKKVLKPFQWLKIYGMNSIVAYFLGEMINFRSVVHSLTYGLENMLPTYKQLILTTGNFTLVFLILLAFYRARIFVKI